MSSVNSPMLSVIITAHAEGILTHRTLASVRRAIGSFIPAINVEIILHVDNATPDTLDYISIHKDSTLRDVVIFKNTFGDLGASRNFTINAAKGKYIATIDADDLMSKDWLVKAVSYLQSCDQPTVAHSEYTVEFEGADSLIIKHGEIDYDTDTLLSVYANRWNSVIVAPRELLLQYPYTPNSPGYGYEDWNLNCRLIYGRVHNVLIPETAIFVRRKLTNSEWARQVQSASVLRANPLLAFDNIRNIKDPFGVSQNLTTSSDSKQIYQAAKQFVKRHRVIHKLAKHLKRSLKRRTISLPIGAPRVPKWLQLEWSGLHAIDRQIFLSSNLMSSISVYDTLTYEHKIAGSLYKSLVDQMRYDSYSYILFVPWLIRGGADKYSINYANAIAKIQHEKVLVIATLPTPSTWKDQLENDVDFIDFGLITQGVGAEIKHRLMEHLVENSKARTLHVINSEFGYDFLQLHENYIRSSGKKVVVTSFSQSVDSNTGKIFGYSHTHVPFVYNLTSFITSDNQAVIDMWVRDYGFDPAKLLVHHQPVSISENSNLRTPHKPLRVLWAGRVADEKMPDMVKSIAEKLTSQISIDMYGSLDEKYQSLINTLPENVHYKGVYDGFDSINAELYDILLYTSLFDGMPNVILESASIGLPIIASSVGGIPEFIIDKKTGLLIEDYLNTNSYVKALTDIINNPELLELIAAGAKKELQKNYSQKQYNTSIASMLSILDK